MRLSKQSTETRAGWLEGKETCPGPAVAAAAGLSGTAGVGGALPASFIHLWVVRVLLLIL